MKKLLLHFVLPCTIIAAAVLAIGTSCGPGPGPTVAASCDTTNSAFRQLYLNSKNTLSGSTENNTWDLLTHEYSFKVSVAKIICAIGYQGNAAVFAASVPYTIEITNSTGTILFTNNYIFNSTRVDYRSITPLALVANQTYIIKRRLTNNLSNLNNNIGKVLLFNVGNRYPIVVGDLTLTASNFYDATPGPLVNYGIPYVDIVFQ